MKLNSEPGLAREDEDHWNQRITAITKRLNAEHGCDGNHEEKKEGEEETKK
jgi:hypothetical protein